MNSAAHVLFSLFASFVWSVLPSREVLDAKRESNDHQYERNAPERPDRVVEDVDPSEQRKSCCEEQEGDDSGA